RGELASIPSTALASPTQRASVPMRLEAATLRSRYTSSTKSHDVVFAAVVGCVLLIACANLANLALVRTLHQQRELAVRAALGAPAGRLARGLLIQYGVVVLLATLLGLAFASWVLGLLKSIEVLQSLRPSGMEYRLDARVVGFAALLALAAAALLGSVSARVAASADVQQLLRHAAPASGVGRWRSRAGAQQLFVV